MENERRYYDEVEQKYTEHPAHDAVQELMDELERAQIGRQLMVRDLTTIATYIGAEPNMSAVVARLGELLEAEKQLQALPKP